MYNTIHTPLLPPSYESIYPVFCRRKHVQQPWIALLNPIPTTQEFAHTAKKTLLNCRSAGILAVSGLHNFTSGPEKIFLGPETGKLMLIFIPGPGGAFPYLIS
jgi:hypothetical protein